MQRYFVGTVLLGILVAGVAGCPDIASVGESDQGGSRPTPHSAPTDSGAKPDEKTPDDNHGLPEPNRLDDSGSGVKGSGHTSGNVRPYGDTGNFMLPSTIGAAANPSSGGPMPSSDGSQMVEDDTTRALKRIGGEVRESLKFKKTLVVWLLDQAPESSMVRRSIGGEIRRLSQNAVDGSRKGGSDGSPLFTAVIAYGSDVTLLTPEPSDDLSKVDGLINGIQADSAGPSLTFTAVHRAVEQFLPYRGKGFEVIFVIVANNAGKDYENFEADTRLLNRMAVPVYGIGYTVPFARMSGGFQDSKASGAAPPPCDSVALERIDMSLPGGQSDIDLTDSGYGPMGLEWLCRATEGQFFRIRPTGLGVGWELESNGEVRQELLRKYAPDFVTDKQYGELLAKNKCRMALHNAAMIPHVDQLGFVKREFYRGSNEAALSKAISNAQRAAAEREPDVNKLYDALAAGESDRASLTGARWQVEFDLAMGRVLAAKARIDGYNTQLAVVKLGKAFANPNSTTWILHPADTISAGSVLEKIAKNSQMYLHRVIHDNPGTPWAAMATRELGERVGWEWSER